MKIAIVHDYLTQRGGAERVVLSLTRAFPDAAVYTSLYNSDATFPEFRSVDVRTTLLDRVPGLRRHHRLAFPLLAPAFSHLSIEADVVLCSSSGWAHGVSVDGRKIVYCHAPARWLYQPRRYAPRLVSQAGMALALLRAPLLRWDRRAAHSAHRYLANSHAVREHVRELYGIEAQVLAPAPALDGAGQQAPLDLDQGFFLCVSRFLPYKNVGAAVAAFAVLPESRLVVVGNGPAAAALRAAAPPNVHFAGTVPDDVLRALYAHSRGLVAPAYEDYGLTPLEAAGFGKPTAALRFGGYLDTVVEGRNGVFFDQPHPGNIAAAVRRLESERWNDGAIRAHAETFSEARFVDRIRAIVSEEAALGAKAREG